MYKEKHMGFTLPNFSKKNLGGFTLIELLVVLAIVGLLISVVVVSAQSTKDKARIAKALQFSATIKHSLGVDIEGEWTFDDCPAGTAKDTSGYGNDGTIIGAACTNDTPYKIVGQGSGKNALSFDGINDYVGTPYIQSNVTAYTIEVWVKTTDGGGDIWGTGQALVQDRGDGSGLSLTLLIGKTGAVGGGKGKVSFVLDSDLIDIGVSSKQVINDDKWHHVIGTWSAPATTEIDPPQFKIYIDGVEASITTNDLWNVVPSPVSPLSGKGNVKIGWHEKWGTFYKGYIDEVRIYKNALTKAEIQQHYAEGAKKRGITAND